MEVWVGCLPAGRLSFAGAHFNTVLFLQLDSVCSLPPHHTALPPPHLVRGGAGTIMAPLGLALVHTFNGSNIPLAEWEGIEKVCSACIRLPPS